MPDTVKHHELSADADKYNQPAGYTSVIPWPVYMGLQNKWTQGIFECDRDWVRRLTMNWLVAANRKLVNDLMPLASVGFREELLEKVQSKNWGAGAMRRDELMGELSRVATRQVYSDGGKGTAAKLVPLDSKDDDSPLAVKGDRYDDRCKEILEKLVEATNVDTPENGSIFWNGIDQRALVLHVEKWNTELPGVFGQLEATTDVRHVDGMFVWDGSARGVNLQTYFAGVSENLGEKAIGHMTAAVLWGFRDTSILTYAELPRILTNMATALEKDGKPAVTDVSIVVIDALNSNGDVNIVNNSAILELPIWTPKAGKKGYSKNECESTGVKLKHFINTQGPFVGKPTIPDSKRLFEYLSSRPSVDSPAAQRIFKDARKLVRASNIF